MKKNCQCKNEDHITHDLPEKSEELTKTVHFDEKKSIHV